MFLDNSLETSVCTRGSQPWCTQLVTNSCSGGSAPASARYTPLLTVIAVASISIVALIPRDHLKKKLDTPLPIVSPQTCASILCYGRTL